MSRAEVISGFSPASFQTSAKISGWCHSAGKRAFDLVCTVPVLIAFLPLMLVVGLVVKLTSTGPALFRQNRVGMMGKEFQLLKFRTMSHGSRQTGPGLTRAGDSRVTRTGRVLRKWKLDELPQLLNVVRGDMSLVGPRPDLAQYINALGPECREVVRLRPGITGAATLQMRHEEELLSTVPPEELTDFYVNTLLPRKVALDLQYAASAGLVSDVGLLFQTVAAIVM